MSPNQKLFECLVGIYRSPGGRFTMIPSSCEQQKAAIPEYDDLLVVIILVVVNLGSE